MTNAIPKHPVQSATRGNVLVPSALMCAVLMAESVCPFPTKLLTPGKKQLTVQNSESFTFVYMQISHFVQKHAMRRGRAMQTKRFGTLESMFKNISSLRMYSPHTKCTSQWCVPLSTHFGVHVPQT